MWSLAAVAAFRHRPPHDLGEECLHGMTRIGLTRRNRREWASASTNDESAVFLLGSCFAAQRVEKLDGSVHARLESTGRGLSERRRKSTSHALHEYGALLRR